MAKTKEELEALKKELHELTNKLKELSESELNEVCGGVNIWDIAPQKKDIFNNNNN